MRKDHPKVLILATSRKTRGGITSVLKAHQQGAQWNRFNCKWIETHIDKGIFYKLYYLIKSLILFSLNIPFYNIVHIHASEPPSAFRKSIFVALSKLFGKKVIVHFHSFSIETTINGKCQWIYEYIFGKADMIIVLSEYWKEEILKTFRIQNKVEVLYNPCDDPKSIKKYSKKNTILYAGTLNQRKGYADLITAFSLIASKFPKWKLVFAGNGEIDKAKALAFENKVLEQVEFLGWVNGDEKDKAFQEAKIFCLPSYAEGFPMAVLDAWAYGLPTIVTPVGGLPDIVNNGVNSLVFKLGDIQELSKCLVLLIESESIRNKMSVNSLELNDNYFSISKVSTELEVLYKKMINFK